MTDNINPQHYQYDGFEVYDVLRQVFPTDPIGWQVGKYVLRADRKNGLEDWRKAQWYLGKKIAELEASETVAERYADELADDEGVPLSADPPSPYESIKRYADQNGRLTNYADGGVVSREPRVFEYWWDIPPDVTAVKDKDGDIWAWGDTKLQAHELRGVYAPLRDRDYVFQDTENQCAPYTEVVE